MKKVDNEKQSICCEFGTNHQQDPSRAYTITAVITSLATTTTTTTTTTTITITITVD